MHDEGVRTPGRWPLHFKSVIAFGRIRIVDDPQRVVEIATKLSHKFTQDEAYIQNEIAGFARHTLLLEMTVEHLCGKRVQES